MTRKRGCEKCAGLADALRFYAKEETYITRGGLSGHLAPIEFDKGKRALAALADASGHEEEYRRCDRCGARVGENWTDCGVCQHRLSLRASTATPEPTAEARPCQAMTDGRMCLLDLGHRPPCRDDNGPIRIPESGRKDGVSP